MIEASLRELARDYLVPLFSGASIETQAVVSTPGDKLVAHRDPISIFFKISPADTYRLVLRRSQSFAESSEAVLPEIEVVRAFVAAVAQIADYIDGPLKHDLLSTFQRKVVARAISGQERESIMLSGIDQLVQWGARLYEGAPISASIGFRNVDQVDVITLETMAKEDFAAVLGNGFDTIVEYDFLGRFIGVTPLQVPEVPSAFCPYRQTQIAEWATEPEGRIGMSLNRLGEILVFRNKELLFARRSGRWNFLTHKPVLKQMRTPRAVVGRRAIYETCLDASFARTGACIGVVESGHAGEWTDLVEETDRIANGMSVKAQAVRKTVGGQKFFEIDRRLRQEMVAIDGATILDHESKVLAVGAIVSVPAGSKGGGRLAAAKEISKLGLGIKVSQDGGITGYRKDEDDPAFKVM